MKTPNIFGKFLDQPLLVANFKKSVPYILSGCGALYTGYEIKKSEPDKRKETMMRVGTTMFFTVLSALAAPKIVNKIFKKHDKSIKTIKKSNTEFVDKFIKENNLNTETKKILNKSKENVLNYKEIKTLYKNTKNNPELSKLIPEPENISSKEIFSEIGRLSLLGLIPVVGGIAGGITGDVVTTDTWKDKVPNKIKEGAYQYLANIFLCNVGAGTALAIMEKAGVKGKAPRALGMICGIVTMGILGGSAIANTIGNKIINPLFEKNKQTTKNIPNENIHNKLYEERKPEALDIGLHVDDIATVAVMSGLKWIEPALPIMYAISGYRAGIGYRNVNKCNKINKSWNTPF